MNDHHILVVNPGSSSIKQLNSQSLNSCSTSHPLKTNDVYQGLSDCFCRYYEQLDITAIAYRVVHGGDKYNECVPIDDSVLQYLISLYPLAPLREPFCIDAIQHIKKMA